MINSLHKEKFPGDVDRISSSGPSPCQSDTKTHEKQDQRKKTKPVKLVWLFSRIHKTVMISLFFQKSKPSFLVYFATIVHI